MVDVVTFLTILYVMVDDFCQSQPPKTKPGPQASLSESEVVTLVIFARWRRFASERDFYRLRRRSAAGCLPNSAQPLSVQPTGALQCRSHRVSSFAPGATLLDARKCSYEALDSSAMPTRDAKRRGGHGWMAGSADIGWSNSLGWWYEGFRLLVAVDPTGVITGFGFAPASTADQQMAEAFFALRAYPDTRLGSVGVLPLRGHITWSTRALRVPKTTGNGSSTTEHKSSARPNAQRPRGVAEALEALGSRNPPDHRDRLRKAVQRLWPLGGKAP